MAAAWRSVCGFTLSLAIIASEQEIVDVGAAAGHAADDAIRAADGCGASGRQVPRRTPAWTASRRRSIRSAGVSHTPRPLLLLQAEVRLDMIIVIEGPKNDVAASRFSSADTDRT